MANATGRVCAITHRTVRHFASIVGGDVLDAPCGTMPFLPNKTATRERCRDGRPRPSVLYIADRGRFGSRSEVENGPYEFVR